MLHAAFRRVSVVVLMLLAAHGHATGQALDVATLYRRAAPSVAVIIATDANMQPLAYGTGFFVDATGSLVTNYHVIQGAQTVAVRLRGSEDLVLVESVLALDTVRDLAVLKVPTARSVPLPLTVTRPVVGERIAAIGNPMGLESTVSEGIVSGIRQMDDYELYQITAPISPGSSGGPVLTARGEALGVATASLREGQNLNFAVPAADVDRLIKAVAAPIPVARATRARLAQPKATETRSTGLRVVDVKLSPLYGSSAVLFNGSQFVIRGVLIRVVCWKTGLDVPVGYLDVTIAKAGDYPVPADPVPPGLSESFEFYCREGTTRAEFRILDYKIVR